MFRLLGIIVGVALVAWAGIAWLDKSRAERINDQLHAQMDQAIDRIATGKPAAGEIVEDIAAIPSAAADMVEDVATLPQEVRTLIDDRGATGAPTPAAEPSASSDPIDLSQLRLAQSEPEEEQPWQIFWKPFGSQTSARGFADRLQQLTGVKISVIGASNGLYRVSFSYVDDADRERIEQLITETTGVEVSKS